MNKYYFVGSGIASLAGAAYLIRDAEALGKEITIFEAADDAGGALDAHGSPQLGYFMSGSRMFEHHYNATLDLLSFIPSVSDPLLSIKEETERVEKDAEWHNKARLINLDGVTVDFHQMGFSERDRLDLFALMARTEHSLDSKRITDCFDEHFFQTNFWFEWCTLFAFESWHSAIEFRRYLLRFIHHFSTIDTQEGIFRTRYNQYEAIAMPIVKWLRDKGVEFRMGTRVIDLGFATDPDSITVNSLTTVSGGVTQEIPVGEEDLVFVTNGSMTADKSFGSMTMAPTQAVGGEAWKLWEVMAAGRPDFGNPTVFNGHIDESAWESFTVTVSDPKFFRLMEAYTGSAPGRGGLLTFKDSQWLLTLSIFKQPFYVDQPADVSVWWGYGLYLDRPGDYVKKPMKECTGMEILEEALGHLHFDDDREAILASSICIPCMMPYITSQFLVRKHGDRPQVVPPKSKNLAFIGQFAELPDDVVFTVEYSVRSAQMAVYTLLDLEMEPSTFYKGQYDLGVLWDAFKTMLR
ncbi:MAG: oleate hydratase [Fimbriimonas sp.]|nr:oleate hydratase [Fimbriimonas sp.]